MWQNYHNSRGQGQGVDAHMSPHLAIGSTGPAPPPNLIPRPRSIAARTKSFDLATASGNGAPRTTCAAIALDSVQPVPCTLGEAMRGAAKLWIASAITR